ncbi:MAG: rRNA (pseudouridine1915-N3)-methyltransferase [Patescibacteria group bacterium]|jgi:23S rRNA (pseudouridine1915-N3)-methyltransferase|nr:rRNA (pseudouridine1915-N3)-methyltransferase [Patescibacteria group bacterium]
MKLHIVTIGSPKLAYAKLGWDEYLSRLKHYHSVRVTHIADRQNDAVHILEAASKAYKVALVIDGPELSSPELAGFLDKKALDGNEVCFIIGGPDGLTDEVINACDKKWGFSRLTFPHDLAMVILVESLYRASTINDGLPYHK